MFEGKPQKLIAKGADLCCIQKWEGLAEEKCEFSTPPWFSNKILKKFILPSADKLKGDADFIFQQNLTRAETYKQCQYLLLMDPMLAGAANLPDQNLKKNLCGFSLNYNYPK